MKESDCITSMMRFLPESCQHPRYTGGVGNVSYAYTLMAFRPPQVCEESPAQSVVHMAAPNSVGSSESTP